MLQLSPTSLGSPFPADIHTVFILGDLHGFLDDAHRIVTERIGAGPDWLLPPGVAVIQTGDLLHKGDEGPALLTRIERAIEINDGRWVQLWGNHESAALQGRPHSWHPEPADITTRLRRWWDNGAVQVACWVPTTTGDMLITHAGLSAGWWDRIGAPESAAETAAALNEPLGACPEQAFGRGWLLDRGAPSAHAGPVWNDTAAEGWARWADRGEVPFSQVHGHAAPWSWHHQRWMTGATETLRDNVLLDHTRRRAQLFLPGGTLTSIDTAPQSGLGIPGDPLLEVKLRSHQHALVA